LQVADLLGNGGREEVLEVDQDVVLANLEVEVNSTIKGSPEKVKHLCAA
jgi:hypothetical protein